MITDILKAKLAPYLVAAVIALGAGLYVKGRFDGASAESDRATAAQAVATQQRNQELETANETIRNMPAIERCRALARSSGMPASTCD